MLPDMVTDLETRRLARRRLSCRSIRPAPVLDSAHAQEETYQEKYSEEEILQPEEDYPQEEICSAQENRSIYGAERRRICANPSRRCPGGQQSIGVTKIS